MTFREKLLSLLIRWLRFATPVESENTFEGEKPKRRKITAFDLGRVGSGKTEKTVTQFKMPTLPKGVIPDGEGLAMDSGGMVGYANSAGVSMNFLGYPVLSELSQRSEYRAPVQTLATEMTRKWIQFKSIGSKDLSEKIKQIEVAFDHFKIRDAFKLATEHDGFFGRGNLFVEIEGNDDRETPLIVDKATIKKGSLKQLKVIEPIWTTPVNYDSIDPTNKYFYKPNMWYVMGKPVHSSRLFTFISHPVADMLKPSYNFSGLSMTQMMMPYVDNWLSTRDSVSDLIHSFSTSGIKTNMDAMLSEGNEGDATDIINRAELFNRMRDNRGLMMLDTSTDEEFFQYNTPLSGLDKLQAQAQEQMAAPCHIPLVKLFGITPSGLNASSEGEIKVYYDYVAAQQQSIYTDPLVTILKIIQLHLFGQIYDDITFEFVPLEQMTEEQIANINKIKADTGAVLVEAGVISVEEERTRLADDSFSGYNSLDVENLPEHDDSDPAMDADGEWDESKHPRDERGRFGSGSSSGKNPLTRGFAPIHPMAASGSGRSGIKSQPAPESLPSSENISTMAEAEQYWNTHFKGKTYDLNVHSRKASDQPIPIKVSFGETNHAYSEKPIGASHHNNERVLSQERAKMLDKILPTIQHPRTHLISRGNDLLIAREMINKQYFTVCLSWSDVRQVYDFESSHFKSERQLEGIKQNQRNEKKNKNKGSLQK